MRLYSLIILCLYDIDDLSFTATFEHKYLCIYCTAMESEETIEKLLAYQQELRREETFLRETLAKIDSQHHALRVEELHLLNSIKDSLLAQNYHTSSKPQMSNQTPYMQVYESTMLDLAVPQYIGCDEDDEELEEQDD